MPVALEEEEKNTRERRKKWNENDVMATSNVMTITITVIIRTPVWLGHSWFFFCPFIHSFIHHRKHKNRGLKEHCIDTCTHSYRWVVLFYFSLLCNTHIKHTVCAYVPWFPISVFSIYLHLCFGSNDISLFFVVLVVVC